MALELMRGNEAVAEGAIRAGCRFYAGYPITPQNELFEYMAKRHSRGRRGFSAMRERGCRNQHDLGRGLHGNPGHDLFLRAGHQPHVGRADHVGRRRASLRNRGRHPGRPRSGADCPGSIRLSPSDQGRRPRRLPRHCFGARFDSGDGGTGHPGLLSGRPVPQSRSSS